MPKEIKKPAVKKAPAKDAATEAATAEVKKPSVKEVATKTPITKQSSLSVGVLDLDGKASGNLSLPKEIFGAEVNEALLTQALKVYSTNQMAHHGHTKTRGEVNLTTAKWFRQKGTGRARHGAKSAPIFVGGGVAMGPRARKVVLDLPEKMKKAALISALSQRAKEGQVSAVEGLDKASGKTKQMANLLGGKEGKILVIVEKSDAAARATRNLPKVTMLNTDHLNAYEVIKHKSLVLTKEAVEKLEQRLLRPASAKTPTGKEGVASTGAQPIVPERAAASRRATK